MKTNKENETKQCTVPSVSGIEAKFCGGCGIERTYKVETDINSGKICRNALCKQH